MQVEQTTKKAMNYVPKNLQNKDFPKDSRSNNIQVVPQNYFQVEFSKPDAKKYPHSKMLYAETNDNEARCTKPCHIRFFT